MWFDSPIMHCVTAGSRSSVPFPVLLSSVLTDPVDAIEMLLRHLNGFFGSESGNVFGLLLFMV